MLTKAGLCSKQTGIRSFKCIVHFACRSLEPEIILSHVTKPTDKLPSGNVNAFIESAEMNTNLIRLINVISFHQKTYVKLDDDPNLPSNLISLFRLPNDFVCGEYWVCNYYYF